MAERTKQVVKALFNGQGKAIFRRILWIVVVWAAGSFLFIDILKWFDRIFSLYILIVAVLGNLLSNKYKSKQHDRK